MRNKGITAIKIVISIALIYFIFTIINFDDVLKILKTANPFYLLLATLLFICSKIIAAFRLNLYFHKLGIYLTQESNLKLYILGMFYNLFLPGGIGGDAYKGFIIKKQFDVATKKIVSVLILDRLSGLVLLFIYACILGVFLTTDFLNGYKPLLFVAIIISIMLFWGINKKYFPYVLPVFWKSLGYSAFVQLAQLGSVFFILKALSVQIHTVAYLFVFLISSIVSVLPITLGGIGSRELTFIYGAKYLGLDEDTSLAISLLFFTITALVSLFGVYYHIKKPALETLDDESKQSLI